MDKKSIIGAEEWVALPNLSIPLIKARIDSGAKTSSIHALNIVPFEHQSEIWVRFDIYPLQNDGKRKVSCQAKVVDRRVIKSSTGTREYRYVVQTEIELNGMRWNIELSLTNRDSMGYRMLLGRQAMKDRLIVDPAESFLSGSCDREKALSHYKTTRPERKGLRIALLASNPDLYSNKRIIEAGEQLGHEMEFFNIKQCFMKLDAETPEIHYRGGRVLNDFDAIIPRIRPSQTFYGCALTRLFESTGVFSLNSSDAISKSRDKLYSLQLLLSNGIQIPTTGFASSPLETTDLISMVGGSPLIVKLLEGTQGKGVVLAETKKAAESVINAFKSLNTNILVQEFIKEAEGKDLRCFVIDGKVVASMERTAPPGEFRANMHLGGSSKIVKITPLEKRIAIKATKAMGLKVAGVDIIRSSNGPLLLEVNSSPGLEGIENATKKDIAQLMISSIEKHCGHKTKATKTKKNN